MTTRHRPYFLPCSDHEYQASIFISIVGTFRASHLVNKDSARKRSKIKSDAFPLTYFLEKAIPFRAKSRPFKSPTETFNRVTDKSRTSTGTQPHGLIINNIIADCCIASICEVLLDLIQSFILFPSSFFPFSPSTHLQNARHITDEGNKGGHQLTESDCPGL